MCTREGESRGSVVERRAGPIGRGVTGLTSRRESCLNVAGIRRAVVIGLMALHARSRIGQVVCSARTERAVVALGTLQRDMSAIQGKAGRRVVEGGAAPTRGVVALLTGGREIRLYVAGVRRAVEIGLMTLHARSGSRKAICSARAERCVVALGAL